MWIRKGVKLIEEEPGNGTPIERHQYYLLAIRITLSRGDIVLHPDKCLGHLLDDATKINEEGYFIHHVRIDRENLFSGLFYAVQGMDLGGYRKVKIAPHLAYGEHGIPGVIPPNAKLTVEIKPLKAM